MARFFTRFFTRQKIEQKSSRLVTLLSESSGSQAKELLLNENRAVWPKKYINVCSDIYDSK